MHGTPQACFHSWRRSLARQPGIVALLVEGALIALLFQGCRFGLGSGDDGLEDGLVADVTATDGDSKADEPGENSPAAPAGNNDDSPATARASTATTPTAAPSTSAGPKAAGSGKASTSATSKPAASSTGSSTTPGTVAKPTTQAAPAAAPKCGESSKSQMCDPLKNTGCVAELGMQCDVDLVATSLAGVCVFKAAPTDPAGCQNIPPTESCEPGTTCVEGNCQKVCLCDDDCDAGTCCKHPLGSGGWKSCTAC
jgi:hypothetical protein